MPKQALPSYVFVVKSNKQKDNGFENHYVLSEPTTQDKAYELMLHWAQSESSHGDVENNVFRLYIPQHEYSTFREKRPGTFVSKSDIDDFLGLNNLYKTKIEKITKELEKVRKESEMFRQQRFQFMASPSVGAGAASTAVQKEEHKEEAEAPTVR